MSEDRERLRRAAWDRDDQVLEVNAASPGDRGHEGLAPHAEPDLRDVVRDPVGGADGTRRPRRSVRKGLREVSRQGCGARLVEGRRKCGNGCPERGRLSDAEGRYEQGNSDEQPGTPVEPGVDRPLERAGARTRPHGRPIRGHAEAIVGSRDRDLGRHTALAMADSSTILLVDDEDSVQKLLTYPLERDGFRVVQARDGEQALTLFGHEQIDLVVLDLMLPKVDGLEVCRRLRAGSDVPIIMLTARGEELDKVLGLELGADDYITKPFSIREFRSRVRALLRPAALRRDRFQRDGQVIESGDLRIDPAKRTVELDGEPVQLTYVEFELLRTLAAEPGRVFTREMLLRTLWGDSAYREPRTID